MEWFNVDKAGMAKVLARRSIALALLELVQNGLDEPGVTRVDVKIAPEPGKPYATVTVTDDAPEGFKRLSDAWTLFAESWKKGDATKRGRFNIGEKLVLALATDASIVTTTGSVVFDSNGRRKARKRTEVGSVVTIRLRMTREQVEEAEAALRRLIVPEGIEVHLGGLFTLDTGALPRPERLTEHAVTLPTEIADGEGHLRPTSRKTTIDVYEPLDDSGAWLCEMGIPVVRLLTPWTVNVAQRIPLNLDRDNVSPTYLRKIHAALLNAMQGDLDGIDADAPWVRHGAGAPEIEDNAFAAVLDARFGKDRVMADPTDREAGHRAVAHGHRLVYGNQLNEGERRNLRRARDNGHEPLTPAGQSRFQTYRPLDGGPGARPAKVVPESDYTERMTEVVAYAKHVAAEIGVTDRLTVTIISEITERFAAAYSPGHLTLNLGRLGHRWFDRTSADALERVNDLLIHEYGHHYESDHLSSKYHDALTDLGAKLTRAALERRLRPGDFGYTLGGGR
jgi:hypothetical protein